MLSNERFAIARRRAALLGSTALMLAALAAPASAQDAGSRPILDDAELEAYSTGADIGDPYGVPEAYDAGLNISTPGPRNVRIEDFVAPESQIVISNPGTPTTARDPNNVTGIGQMIVDNGNGTLGLCTGSLINPRTVLFAAHCVNSRAATAYGSGQGGTPIGFGFEAFLRNEAAGRPDELGQWFFAGPNQYRTNVASSFFTVSQVRYNVLSLEAESRGFLYGDVATATLDTPAANVPLWAMLFSQLPAPATTTAAGTGYNVQIAGYGGNGNAATGSTGGIDFRRRVAENIIGALTDLRQFETFLFGSSTSPTQNLYFIDFDDPRRGLTGASPFDFNAFRDNARGVGQALPTEGNTAGGDSGGPLILQNFGSRQLIAGVLSGGYTRFFLGQPANGYGTVSFYQPLYLYWDWIAANNPYRYVTNLAGDRNWTDAANWITTTDPNYFIIGPNGQVVNGVPNDLGLEKNGTTGDFGEICFESGGSFECRNTRTGQETAGTRPIGTEGSSPAADGVAGANNHAGVATAEEIGASRAGWIDGVAAEAFADGGATTQALPPATIANGLPGAINFVPNNVDPVRTTGAIGRYFDVTLVANGTTTLNTAVTIDRFMIGGAGARLNIAATTGSLTSLIDVRQMAGIMQVDGTLTSRGDFLLAGGALMGSGRINAPFLTNVMGTITGGTDTTIGTLTLGGNLVLSSGSLLFTNIGNAGASDRIAVVANAPATGTAALGGRVTLAPVAGSTLRFNDLYTILTAQGGITGTFTSTDISAILRQTFIYNANSVQVRVTAVPFASVVTPGSPVQGAFATLLDRNRGTGNLTGIFDILDLQNAATIQSTLEALAPRTEALRTSMGVTTVENASRVLRERTQSLTPGNLGGEVAFIGRRVETAALNLAGLSNGSVTMSDVATQEAGSTVQLPETMAAFVSVGYIDGSGAPMTSARPLLGRDSYDGFFGNIGVEAELGERALIGVAFGYTSLDGNTGNRTSLADTTLLQSSIYGKIGFGRYAYADGQILAGQLETDTERQGALPGQAITLRGQDKAFAIAGEVGLGAMFGDRVRFGPRAALRYSSIDFGDIVETGGATALRIDREEYKSFQGRLGLVLDGVGQIRPRVSATYVHDFEERDTVFGANFVGGGGGNALFDLAGQDQDWGELSGGLVLDLGRVEVSVSADTTVGRSDFSNRSYRAGVRIGF